MEDLPLGRIAALVPEFAVKDLPLGRTLMMIHKQILALGTVVDALCPSPLVDSIRGSMDQVEFQSTYVFCQAVMSGGKSEFCNSHSPWYVGDLHYGIYACFLGNPCSYFFLVDISQGSFQVSLSAVEGYFLLFNQIA